MEAASIPFLPTCSGGKSRSSVLTNRVGDSIIQGCHPFGNVPSGRDAVTIQERFENHNHPPSENTALWAICSAFVNADLSMRDFSDGTNRLVWGK